MKRFSLNLAILLMLVSPALTQEINKKQWTLLHERTADWCPFCGTWGWDFKDKLINEFNGKPVIFTAIHHSGGLSNPTSIELSNNFSGSGQPLFYADGTDLNVSSGNQVARLQDAKDIATYNSAVTPYAGIGIDATLDESNDILSIKTKVEILEKIDDGEYYLGLYLLEDLNWKQESKGANAQHKNVIKSSLFNSTFGRKLGSGALQKGTIFTEDVVVTGITQSRNNISILGIIWNKVTNRYMFFNANEVNVALSSSVENSFLNNNLQVYASESGSVFVDIKADEEIKDLTLLLTDIDGKLIQSQNLNQVSVGENRFSFDNIQKSGIVFLTVQKPGFKVTKQVILP
jgi:hypothetical protein